MSGFVDLQVNGYGGVDFNGDALSDQDAATITGKLQSDGVGSALATIITAPLEAPAWLPATATHRLIS